MPSPPPSSPNAATPVKDAPAYDFYPERWLAATAGMTAEEYRAYHILLCQAWLQDGLPADPARLRLMTGRKVPANVLAKFKAGPDGRLRNAFLEEVRATQRLRIQKSRAKIANMNAARTGKPGGVTSVAGSLFTEAGFAKAATASSAPAATPAETTAAAISAEQGSATQQDGLTNDTAKAALVEARQESAQATAAARLVDPHGAALVEAPQDPSCRPSSPVTSHPQTQIQERVNSVRPTREEVLAVVSKLEITVAEADQWWYAREASGWTRSSNGAYLPVSANWQADAKSYTLSSRRREAERAIRTGGGGSSSSSNSANNHIRREGHGHGHGQGNTASSQGRPDTRHRDRLGPNKKPGQISSAHTVLKHAFRDRSIDP